jgi:hypothetical protein
VVEHAAGDPRFRNRQHKRKLQTVWPMRLRHRERRALVLRLRHCVLQRVLPNSGDHRWGWTLPASRCECRER